VGKIDLAAKWASGALLFFGCAAVILMALNITADVVLRGTVNWGIYGTTEIVSFYYMVATVCLPLAFIELRDEHINVEVFFQLLPSFLQRVVLAFSILCTGGFFAVFAWRSWYDSMVALSTRETLMGYAEIPIWPARFILPISFALVVAICLLRLIKLCTGREALPTEVMTDRAEGGDFRA
jgi:TRAP-type C4-dicarboxylate transport system permease small subunit